MTLCDVYCDVPGISLQSHYVGVLDMYVTRETVKHLCQMMARYRGFVFVSFLFLSSVIKFDKKCEVDHCFCKVKNLLSKKKLFITM